MNHYPASIEANFSSVERARNWVYGEYGGCYEMVESVDNGDSVLCMFVALHPIEDMHRQTLLHKLGVYVDGLEKIRANPEISYFASLIEDKIREIELEIEQA